MLIFDTECKNPFFYQYFSSFLRVFLIFFKKKLYKPVFFCYNSIVNQLCGSGSVVERHLAKVNVASSNLVFRSKKEDVKLLYILFFSGDRKNASERTNVSIENGKLKVENYCWFLHFELRISHLKDRLFCVPDFFTSPLSPANIQPRSSILKACLIFVQLSGFLFPRDNCPS